MAARVARALVGRTELPQPFCVEVRKKVIEMSCEDEDEGRDSTDRQSISKKYRVIDNPSFVLT